MQLRERVGMLRNASSARFPRDIEWTCTRRPARCNDPGKAPKNPANTRESKTERKTRKFSPKTKWSISTVEIYLSVAVGEVVLVISRQCIYTVLHHAQFGTLSGSRKVCFQRSRAGVLNAYHIRVIGPDLSTSTEITLIVASRSLLQS